ncbi:MAG TPA: methyltransferase domain-containing protein [Candidatus Saccharimonadales bacterium]|nr:methyltransferase domain-containing protein [Candidatus Saccharimonadales bacterium]
MAVHTPDQAYYDHFEHDGWHLGLMNEILRGQISTERGLVADLRRKEEARFLLLGSATVRNLDNMAIMDRILRPGKGKQDDVYIIDRVRYPLTKHVAHAEWLDEWHKNQTKPLGNGLLYPHFMFAQADMRQLPLPADTIDCVISDYTLNFLQDPADVCTTLGEVRRVLKDDGTFIASIGGNPDWPSGKQVPAEHAHSDNRLTMPAGPELSRLPITTYLRMAAEAKLHIANGVFSGQDMLSGIFKTTVQKLEAFQ